MAGETPPPAPSGSSPPGSGTPAIFHPPEHWAQLAQNHDPEEDGDDADSALGSALSSSTASVSESILQYRTIHGRTYHSERGDANYWAANDDRQNESMDIAHHCVLHMHDNKLFQAPLEKEKIKNVLDIGTGTGIWAIDFADEFPGAEVIGTDISPIQPGWVPPNLKFEIEDCSETWTFRTNSMDYVHMRFLFGSIKDWNSLFKEAYRVCKPGGWFESYEAFPGVRGYDGPIPEGYAMAEWSKFYIEGGKKIGRSFTVLPDDIQEKSMKEAGFVDITVEDVKIPVGSWAKDKKLKEVGQYAQMALEQDYEGYLLYMASEVAGWSMEEVVVFCAQLRREIRSGKHHPHLWYRAVYGRKPES